MKTIDFDNSAVQISAVKIENGELISQGLGTKLTAKMWTNEGFEELAENLDKAFKEWKGEAIDPAKSAIQVTFATIVDGKLERQPIAAPIEKWSKDELVKAREQIINTAKE